MTWPGGPGGQQGEQPGGQQGGQSGQPGGQPGGQGDDPTQHYRGSYSNPFDQQPDQTQQHGSPPDLTQQFQGSYSNPFDPTQQLGPEHTTAYPQPAPFQPGWDGGQQPYQQQPGGYQQPHPGQHPGQHPGGPWQQPPPRRDRTGLWIALAVIGLVLVLGAVTGVILLNRDDDEPVADPPASTATAPGTSEQAPSSDPSTTEPAPTSTGAKPEPVIPGWQVVVSTKRKLAYDVPPGWTVLDEETIIGFEDAEGPQVGMSGAAQLGRGFCAESTSAYRVGTGVSSYRDSDLALAATDAAGKWGRFGYLGPNDEEPTVQVGQPQPAEIADGDGARVLANVSAIPVSPCAPATASVHTAAFPNPDGGAFVFTIISDQGVPEGITNEQADQIMSSIRFTG